MTSPSFWHVLNDLHKSPNQASTWHWALQPSPPSALPSSRSLAVLNVAIAAAGQATFDAPISGDTILVIAASCPFVRNRRHTLVIGRCSGTRRAGRYCCRRRLRRLAQPHRRNCLTRNCCHTRRSRCRWHHHSPQCLTQVMPSPQYALKQSTQLSSRLSLPSSPLRCRCAHNHHRSLRQS